ncbi:MAG: Heterodisulfide reductase, cytochrome reductase subunit [Labilithrix sp.]|nr:Heterodisulfide reductase, cytochrome reductase subunit [Labilithrix sp.]
MPNAVLTARHDAGGGLARVELAVDDVLARGYAAAGQYVGVTTAAGTGYFVLGGRVGANAWELLVRNTGGVSEALHVAPLGSTFEVSAPLGAGFPLATAGSRAVVVAVVASALGVVRPVVATRVEAGQGARTFVFVGLRAAPDLPLAAELAELCAAGVTVVLCLSRAELHHHPHVLPLARRAVGRVQVVLAQALAEGWVPPDALVVAAGPDGMVADLARLPVEVVSNV